MGKENRKLPLAVRDLGNWRIRTLGQSHNYASFLVILTSLIQELCETLEVHNL